MYKVIKSFSDLQDNGFVYKAGDVFPRFGKTVTAERLEELSTDRNRRGEALIEGLPDEPPMIKKEENKAPIERRRKRKNAGTDSQVD
jgi:hypothetical protein